MHGALGSIRRFVDQTSGLPAVLRLEFVRLPVEGTVGATLVLARPSDEETADRLHLLDGTR